MNHKLSKSRILSGLQCEKRLWLQTHKPQAQVVDDNTQYRFAAGHLVNDVACSLHKNGRLIDMENGFADALAETGRMLREAPDTPLFEATFAHHGVLVRVDILKKGARGYRMIEVKSATKVKPQYIPDCAVQAWVLRGNGLPIERVELAHIDNQFVYGGDGDYRGLFYHADLAGEIREQQAQVPEWVARFTEMLAGKEPDVATGAHCDNPYACPFKAYCAEPDSARQTAAGEKARFNSAVKATMASYSHPRYYLDFETISFAVPVWKDTRPYEQLPFQWSCHVEATPGTVTHREFLDTMGDPPMRAFIESLLQVVGKNGPIFVYTSFEKTILRQLAGRFPDLQADIEKIIDRLIDLFSLTKKNYSHPDLQGSYSLKSVLPTVAPNLGYGDLGEVQDGLAAGVAYEEIIHPETAAPRAQALAADLRAYCKRDTEALVALARFLSGGKVQ